jgi:hypothetical protein
LLQKNGKVRIRQRETGKTTAKAPPHGTIPTKRHQANLYDLTQTRMKNKAYANKAVTTSVISTIIIGVSKCDFRQKSI